MAEAEQSTELVPTETEEEEVERAGESVAEYWVPPNLPKHFLSNRDGRTVVSFAGLIYMLHFATMGEFECVNEPVQRGSKDNGDETIVRCTLTGFRRLEGSTDKVPFKVVCEGDAAPGNVGSIIVKHVRRMAETRAMARAMRVATNVGLTAADELGPTSGGRSAPKGEQKSYPQRVSRDYGPAAQRPQNAQEAPPVAGDDAPPPEPEEAAAAPQYIIVQGKRYTREQVVKAMRGRIEQANKLGITDYQRVGEDASLPDIVGFTQSLRKRIEAKEKEGEGEQAPPAEEQQ